MEEWISFTEKLKSHDIKMKRMPLEVLQINLGYLCNQSCTHCHVDAGPNKLKENMDRETMDRILDLASKSKSLKVVDLTGGAPELNPNFRYSVKKFKEMGLEVIDRCNLTILSEKGQEDLAHFLADCGVHIIASLPCYTKETVESQRGNGVFDRSIQGLKQLNQLGYGLPQSGLKLDLVYNPSGPRLPPSQDELSAEYKKKLQEDFGIVFNQLFTITNMPIKRFKFYLKRQKQLDSYMQLLESNFNPSSCQQLMCKNYLSISWDGHIYDCDFNQLEAMPVGNRPKTSVWDIESFTTFDDSSISLADHCYGCTAGSGSSCQGQLTE